jgi:hypothetical protein
MKRKGGASRWKKNRGKEGEGLSGLQKTGKKHLSRNLNICAQSPGSGRVLSFVPEILLSPQARIPSPQQPIDALLLSVNSTTLRRRRTAAVLFLDIEGASGAQSLQLCALCGPRFKMRILLGHW